MAAGTARAIGLRKQKIGNWRQAPAARSLLSGGNTFIGYAMRLCRTEAEVAL